MPVRFIWIPACRDVLQRRRDWQRLSIGILPLMLSAAVGFETIASRQPYWSQLETGGQ